MTSATRKVDRPPSAERAPSSRRWLLFVHQLPSSPSSIRVRTWRRLQHIGALVVKQAVYVLPDSPGAREDFEWLKTEIEGAGGQASVFSADSVDAWSDDALVEGFRRSRQADYTQLAREIDNALRRLASRRVREADRGPAAHRLLESFRQRLTGVERVDFFGSAGRDRVVAVLDQFAARLSPAAPTATKPSHGDTSSEAYRHRLWVTRPRPGVDRMASAWLIRRFIDAEARFGFVADREAPREAVPFDMFGVELSHHGNHCTFETLCKTFGIIDPAVARVANIVHDLDLKDGHFGAPEAPTIGTVIEGLQLAHREDDALLEHGMALFEALHCAFEQSARRAGPRPVARQRRRKRKR